MAGLPFGSQRPNGSPAQKDTNKVVWVFPKIGVPQNGWYIMETPIKTDDLGVPLFLETPVCTFWYLAGWRGTQHEKYIWKSTFVVGSEVDQHRLGMAQLDTWKQFRALSFLFETPMIPMILIYFNQFFLIY